MRKIAPSILPNPSNRYALMRTVLISVKDFDHGTDLFVNACFEKIDTKIIPT